MRGEIGGSALSNWLTLTRHASRSEHSVQAGQYDFCSEECLERWLRSIALGSARDWPEDFADENGKYQCQCIYCAEYFFGHKRRFICKLCDGKPGEVVTSAPNDQAH